MSRVDISVEHTCHSVLQADFTVILKYSGGTDSGQWKKVSAKNQSKSISDKNLEKVWFNQKSIKIYFLQN